MIITDLMNARIVLYSPVSRTVTILSYNKYKCVGIRNWKLLLFLYFNESQVINIKIHYSLLMAGM